MLKRRWLPQFRDMDMESLPQVQSGTARFRADCRRNPISGNSHVSGQLSREMADYFTAAKINTTPPGM